MDDQGFRSPRRQVRAALLKTYRPACMYFARSLSSMDLRLFLTCRVIRNEYPLALITHAYPIRLDTLRALWLLLAALKVENNQRIDSAPALPWCGKGRIGRNSPRSCAACTYCSPSACPGRRRYTYIYKYIPGIFNNM